MKKMVMCLMAIFTFLIMKNVNADSIIKDFELETGLDIIQDVERSQNGYIYVAGEKNLHLGVEKYNSDNTLVWSKELPDYEAAVSMTIDEDDNVYAIYSNHFLSYEDPTTHIEIDCNYVRTFLVKLNSNGEEVYHKAIDENPANHTSASVIRYRNNKLYILSENMDNIRVENYTGDSFDKVTDGKYCTYVFNKNGSLIKKITLSEEGEYKEPYELINNSIANCGTAWGLTRENNYLLTEDGIYLTISTFDLTFRFAKLNDENQLLWSKKVFMDEEKFLFGSAKDLTIANDGNIIIAGTTADEYEDKTEQVRQWYGDDEEIPLYLCYDTIDLPSFVKIDRNGNILERITILDQGGWVFNVRNQDNGYYAAVYLTSLNVGDIENTERGYYLIRYDYNFNIKDAIKLNSLTFSTNDIDSGIFIFNNGTITRYYVEESNDYEENKVIFTSKRDNYISNIFANLTEEQVKEINWIVEDKTIANVEEGNIIPLKAGNTKITGVYRREDYVIHLEVTDDMIQKNPLTMNSFIVFMISTLICGMWIGAYYIKMNNKKQI